MFVYHWQAPVKNPLQHGWRDCEAVSTLHLSLLLRILKPILVLELRGTKIFEEGQGRQFRKQSLMV